MTTQRKTLLAASAAALLLSTGCQSWRVSPSMKSAPAAESDVATTAPVIAPAAVATDTPAPATTTAPAPTGVLAGPPLYVSPDADEATRRRNWNTTTSYYANGNVVAGPVYRLLPPEPKTNHPLDVAVIEAETTALTVPQFIATPFVMLFLPPWATPVQYHGEEYPPSYTLDDPYPYYVDEKVPGIHQFRR